MRVLAFGEVMMRLMAPDHKTLEQTHSFETLYTGTGVNILGGLSRLDVDVRLLSALPDNRLGKAAASSLRHLGIDTSFIRYDYDHMGMYFLEKGFGARSSYVTYMNRSMSAFARHSYENLDFDALLLDVDCVHICGISLIQKNTADVALTLAHKANQKKVKVVFDCNFRESLWSEDQDSITPYLKMLDCADWVFGTARDVKRLYPEMIDVDDAVALEEFRTKHHIDFIFGTHRHDTQLSASVVSKNGVFESARYPLQVFDRVGGGDGFALGIIFGLLSDFDLSRTLDFGVASGVLAHTNYGDTPVVNREDIENFVKGIQIELVR